MAARDGTAATIGVSGGDPVSALLAGGLRPLFGLAVPLLLLHAFDGTVVAGRVEELYLVAAVAGVALCLEAVLLATAEPRSARGDTQAGLLSALVFGAFLGFVGGVLVVVPVVAGIVHLAATAVIGKRRRALVDGLTEGVARRRSFFRHLFAGLFTIKALGLEDSLRRQAATVNGAGRGEAAASAWLAGVERATGWALGWLTIAGIALLGTVGHGPAVAFLPPVTVGQLAAAMLAGFCAFRGVRLAVAARYRLDPPAGGVPGGGLRALADATDDLPPLPAITGSLYLDNVGMEVGEGSHALPFDNIRLAVDPGEVVALSGGRPAERRALLRVIAGLDRPTRGEVLVDGHDLARFRAASVRRQIAYVPRLGPVFAGSILENLTGFRADLEGDARDAAGLTGFDAAVAALPDGFETRLTGVTGSLPAGFRQHLAVTRAMAVKPRVLVLDAPLDNLDIRDAVAFNDLLKLLKGRVTIVVADPDERLKALVQRTVDVDGLRNAPPLADEAEQGADDGPDSTGEAG